MYIVSATERGTLHSYYEPHVMSTSGKVLQYYIGSVVRIRIKLGICCRQLSSTVRIFRQLEPQPAHHAESTNINPNPKMSSEFAEFFDFDAQFDYAESIDKLKFVHHRIRDVATIGDRLKTCDNASRSATKGLASHQEHRWEDLEVDMPLHALNETSLDQMSYGELSSLEECQRYFDQYTGSVTSVLEQEYGVFEWQNPPDTLNSELEPHGRTAPEETSMASSDNITLSPVSENDTGNDSDEDSDFFGSEFDGEDAVIYGRGAPEYDETDDHEEDEEKWDGDWQE